MLRQTYLGFVPLNIRAPDTRSTVDTTVATGVRRFDWVEKLRLPSGGEQDALKADPLYVHLANSVRDHRDGL
jgi:hypothetical protein